MEYKERFEKLKQKYLSEKSKKDLLINNKKDLSKEIEKLNEEQHDLSVQRELIIKASDRARKDGKDLMESLCTEAIKEIDSNASLKINDGVKYSSPSIDIALETVADGKVIKTDPSSEDAGGLADLISLSARLSLNILNNDNKAPIFLDEPTKYVSKNNADSAAKFLRNIVDNNNKQLFITTHEGDFLPEYADVHYNIIKEANGVSKVELL